MMTLDVLAIIVARDGVWSLCITRAEVEHSEAQDDGSCEHQSASTAAVLHSEEQT
jgi:hypothetical protein